MKKIAEFFRGYGFVIGVMLIYTSISVHEYSTDRNIFILAEEAILCYVILVRDDRFRTVLRLMKVYEKWIDRNILNRNDDTNDKECYQQNKTDNKILNTE